MSKKENWLDGLIGWDSSFSTIETWFPDDPAIDSDNSDFESYYEDNFNTEHLRVKEGLSPATVKITLPTPAQFSSILPYLKGANSDEGEEYQSVVCHKLFEMCVRVPDSQKMKPVMRAGFKRLPEPAMEFFSKKKPHLVLFYGSWLLNKYLMSEEEKKA